MQLFVCQLCVCLSVIQKRKETLIKQFSTNRHLSFLCQALNMRRKIGFQYIKQNTENILQAETNKK